MHLRSEKGLFEKKGDNKCLDNKLTKAKPIEQKELLLNVHFFLIYLNKYLFKNPLKRVIKKNNKKKNTGRGKHFVFLRHILTTIRSKAQSSTACIPIQAFYF